MIIPSCKTNLLEHMLQGAIVITPNNRLSKQLLEDAYKYSNVLVGEQPICLPYQAFLNHLLQKLKHHLPHKKHPVSLSYLQQRHLWSQSLKQQPVITEGLLESLQEAWIRCQHWNVDLSNTLFQQTSATQLFQQAAQEFQAFLDQHNVLAAGQQVNYLLDNLADLPLPKKLIWVAFDDITPQQRALQQACAQHGCISMQHETIASTNSAVQYAAQDENVEILQLIQWITEQLGSGQRCIGVVVPDLQTKAESLQRLFKRELPEHTVNFSLGRALTKQPLVAHALCWLSLDKVELTPHQVRLLLHSPYLGGSQREFESRAALMQNPNTFQENCMPFTLVMSKFKQYTPELHKLLSSIKPYPDTASAAEWAEHFKERLRELGFPGEYSQNSSAYQCFQRWMALFDELMPLTMITPSLSMHEALDAINALSSSTIFQAQMLQKTSIHVLGLLEASGCTFDSIWITGLTDHCLPQKTHLSPFIPLELQRTYQMPHASPEREYVLAQSILNRLQQTSDLCVISYPCLIGELQQLPSPLIVHLPEFCAGAIVSAEQPRELIEYTENYLLPFNHQQALNGGISVLAHQAKCPFMAFSAHRLHARGQQDIATGLSLSERGQLIHRVMEHTWRQLESHATLLSYTASELEILVTSIIDLALSRFAEMRPVSFSALIHKIEHARIMRLTLSGLEFEKQRPPFIVESLEQSFTLTLADLNFTVRIDRLDRLEDSSSALQKWIIDYKSTLPAYKPWQEERLEDPQLPLYALLDPQINTVMFMQLNTSGVAVSGLSEHESAISGISSVKKERCWADHKQQWHDQLTILAADFKSGACAPKPMKAATCASCDFQLLCRVDPLKRPDFFS